MGVRIIKPGRLPADGPVYVGTCERCGCVVEVQPEAGPFSGSPALICPAAGCRNCIWLRLKGRRIPPQGGSGTAPPQMRS